MTETVDSELALKYKTTSIKHAVGDNLRIYLVLLVLVVLNICRGNSGNGGKSDSEVSRFNVTIKALIKVTHFRLVQLPHSAVQLSGSHH